ncbi:MAG: redoxin family protein [Gammaproteobacteria bacterium]
MTSFSLSYIFLWVLVIALSLVVLALARQVGVLHDRIAPTGALMIAKGLSVGQPAPVVAAVDLDGTTRQLGAARTDGRSTLVIFVSPTCPVCKVLLPVLKASQRSEKDWLHIVLASDGDARAQEDFRVKQGLQSFPYVLSTTLGISYQVNRLPYAVLLDEQGVVLARGLINSREHLESLFEAKRLGVASVQAYLEAHHADRAA